MLAITCLIGILAISTAIFGISARSAQREAEFNRSEAEGLMTFMLGDFVEKLRPIGRLDLLDDVGGKALGYLGRTDNSSPSLASLVSRIKALRLIAEVNGFRGRPEDQRQALSTAAELIKGAPADFSGHPDFLKEAGANAFMLGQAAHQRNELEQAEKHFRDYAAFSKNFAVASLKPSDGWLEQSYAHGALGALAMKRAAYKIAKDEFEAALVLKQQAAAANPPDDSKKVELASAISWVAESHLKLGDPARAIKLYRDEESLLRTIRATDASALSRVALSLMRQALLAVAFGERKDAVKAVTEAESIMQNMASKDPSNRTWQSRLLQTKGRLIEVTMTSENAAESLAKLQDVAEQMEAMAAHDPKNTFLIYQTVKFGLMRTQILSWLGRENEAVQNTDKLLEKLEALHKNAPKDPTLLTFLVDAHLARADLTPRTAANGAPDSNCQMAQSLIETIDYRDSEYALLAAQVKAGLCLGKLSQVSSQMAKLKAMGYRDERYTRYISTHSLLKGKL